VLAQPSLQRCSSRVLRAAEIRPTPNPEPGGGGTK
jgi:hypothetical protein